jgi:hypothetical protein
MDDAARTYRTRLGLRIACAMAAAFWAAAFAAVLRLPGAGPSAAAGALGFALFFVASYLLYARTWIAVGARGLVASSPLRRRPVPFEDVLQVVVRDGIGGRVYAVITRRGLFHFTSLIAHHRELFETILERASLEPRERKDG